jgi:TIR domain
MKIFVSWSGERSLAVASALKEWLPLVVQGCQPWLSTEDLRKGTRWQAEIADALHGASAGILCLTRDNLSSAWLLFEAGAISKALSGSPTLVCTYLIDLASTDVAPPLGMFQAALATRDESFRLIRTLNEAMAAPVPADRLEKLFDKFWPDLEAIISDVQERTATPLKRRDTYEMLEEILGSVRSVGRMVSETATTWEQRALNSWLRNLPEGSGLNNGVNVPLVSLRKAYAQIKADEAEQAARRMFGDTVVSVTPSDDGTVK